MNNAFTGKEYTGYYITSAARHLPKTLEILSGMVTEPLLPADDLEREKGVIIQEIKMYEDHPMERAGEEFENLIYDGNKLGRLIIGSSETVQKVSAKDLREYMSKWYRGGNVLVVVAGKESACQRVSVSENQNGKEVVNLLEEYFGSLESGEMKEYTEKGGYGEESKLHLAKETEQAHFVMGVPAFGMNDPRRYALQIAQVVLGGNMSSRLFNEIREKRGLAYYVRAVLDLSFDSGYLAVKAGVKLDKLEEAKSVVRSEMLKLAETLTEKEVVRAKEYLLGKLPLSLEGSMEVAQFAGMRALMTDEVRQPQEVVEAIEKVSLKDVKKVLEQVMVESEIRTCVVGPK
jgi:predicted Zn-dependent peptidase